MSAKQNYLLNLPGKSCTLKWGWSTINLWNGQTNSCHRCTQVPIEEGFNFHNIKFKADQREKMLRGEWPGEGCQYCKKIEDAGGMSDRIAMNRSEKYIPIHVGSPDNATIHTLEIYFTNKCNMKCIYCTPYYSSLWEKEMEDHGKFSTVNIREISKGVGYEDKNAQFWDWMKNHSHTLKNYNILGGEILYQDEFLQNIEFFNNNPRPNLSMTVFSNFKVPLEKFTRYMGMLEKLKRDNKVGEVIIMSSIDCWGPQQEYVRTGMSLKQWEENMFELCLNFKDINVRTNGVLSSLTIKTIPEFLLKLDEICAITNRKIGFSHDFSVNPTVMCAENFPKGFFDSDMKESIRIMRQIRTGWDRYQDKFEGFMHTMNSVEYRPDLVKGLLVYLRELDARRGTDFTTVFPWLLEFDN